MSGRIAQAENEVNVKREIGLNCIRRSGPHLRSFRQLTTLHMCLRC